MRPIDMDFIPIDREAELLAASERLALAEQKLNQEFLLRVASGVNSFQARRMAEVELLPAVRRAQALYEIALNRMRKS